MCAFLARCALLNTDVRHRSGPYRCSRRSVAWPEGETLSSHVKTSSEHPCVASRLRPNTVRPKTGVAKRFTTSSSQRPGFLRVLMCKLVTRKDETFHRFAHTKNLIRAHFGSRRNCECRSSSRSSRHSVKPSTTQAEQPTTCTVENVWSCPCSGSDAFVAMVESANLRDYSQLVQATSSLPRNTAEQGPIRFSAQV